MRGTLLNPLGTPAMAACFCGPEMASVTLAAALGDSNSPLWIREKQKARRSASRGAKAPIAVAKKEGKTKKTTRRTTKMSRQALSKISSRPGRSSGLLGVGHLHVALWKNICEARHTQAKRGFIPD